LMGAIQKRRFYALLLPSMGVLLQYMQYPLLPVLCLACGLSRMHHELNLVYTPHISPRKSNP